MARHVQDPDTSSEVFVDLMMGTPLSIYVENDIENRESIVDLITKHGGTLATGYVYTPYIIVDPLKDSGQSLYIQYAGKKGKIVLSWRWVEECVNKGHLLTYKTDWGGCKINGTERSGIIAESSSRSQVQSASRSLSGSTNGDNSTRRIEPSSDMDDSSSPSPPASPATRVPWADTNVMQPQVTPTERIPSSNIPPYHWDPERIQPPYNFNYIDGTWIPAPDAFYPQPFQTTFHAPFEPSNDGGPSEEGTNEIRGRKRTRSNSTRKQSKPAPPPRPLITPRAPARSPTPPTRAVPTSHGGHLFTAEDIQYLAKYIDYCQDQGLVLSLREICERLAIRAPHHTYHSWRRYCNKNQIRLGAYIMDPQPSHHDEGEEEGGGTTSVNPTAEGVVCPFQQHRSPTPPKVLYKSTTGKGVAYTTEDINFLMKLLKYRRDQAAESGGDIDMVQFWKDVADKAPHHSRASWMKYWRRHKHELESTDEQPVEPVYVPPAKKMRYSQDDDVLLARLFATCPEGTSDSIFQAFARDHPHHPWKGWQEHHRIHKKKIDRLIEQLSKDNNLVTS